MKLEEALDRFRLAKLSDGLKPKTISGYLYHIKLFIQSLPESCRYIGKVRASDIDRFMSVERQRFAERRKQQALARGDPLTKRNTDASSATMRAHHRALDIFFSWLEDDDESGNPRSPLRNNNGKKRKPPKKDVHEPRRANYADVMAILAIIPKITWLDHRDRAIVQLMLDTGLRAGEVCGLLVADVDMERCELCVRSTKGDKYRYVPFTEKSKREIAMYLMRRPACALQVAPYLFVSAKNAWAGEIRGVLTVSGLEQLWKALCKQANVGKITPHMVRHLYGLKALNDGVRLETVSKLMGHADPGFTLRIYAPLLNETARREYQTHWK